MADSVPTCPGCNQPRPDPLYHGPLPHAPSRLCFDCWCEAWEDILGEIRAEHAGKSASWHSTLAAIWAIANGATRAEAATLAKVTRRTLYSRLHAIQSDPKKSTQMRILFAQNDPSQFRHR